ncbi:MAG: LamG domain-containing protein, partial [Bacteroidales bacterium]|nr:LamG domain-containing protein [Bacteroidales bacterium]
VRLVGRLAGGDIQGLKPLGFGLSKNNLGDSLKLVFELEGDNIAHFVYDEKDLTKTMRDTTFVCEDGKDTTLLTPVRFEEKRIIVRPDVKTGEYVIDLPPVKYRIMEATANGYATLFGGGRTSETKDLTNSLDTLQSTYNGRTNWYHDTYSVIYHAPASVAVTQLRFGAPLEHYGEELVQGYTLDTIRYDSVCTHKSGKWEYTLGYPVYLSDYRYSFRINAREEYHYNNDCNRDLDIVPLRNHNYTVYNGLESGTSIIKGVLDSEGRSDVIARVANISFDAVSTNEALKRFEVSVSINGQDVHSEPIKAFVLGNRLTGNNVMQKIGSTVTLNDVLRDPPGSNSYAWISKGTTYSTSYSVSTTVNASLSFSVDVLRKVNQTLGSYNGTPETGVTTGTWFENSSGINIPIFSFNYVGTGGTTYSYSFSTNERIETSPENTVLGIGAPATVFIGHTVNAYATHAEIFNVVDTATLKMMAPAIEQGAARIVAQKDSTSPALIVSQDLAFTMDETPVQFAYTQNHIVNQIIPQLYSEMASLIHTGDSAAVQEIANATGKMAYWLKDTTIIEIKPKNGGTRIYTNELAEYKKQIDQWIKILADNEYIELYGSNTANRLGSYSLSGGTAFTYTEDGATSASYFSENNETPSYDFATTLIGGFFSWIGKDFADTYDKVKEFIDEKENDNYKNREKQINVSTGPRSWKINFLPVVSNTWDQNGSSSPSFNREIGFSLSQNGVGYVDVDVYRLNSTVDFNNDSTLTSWRTLAANLPVAKDSMKTGNYDCSDFVYLLRGGATSCPYIDENVTQFYRPGTVLDPATVKMESPRIEVDKHEVSGVAADGVAVFDLQIWNETEVPVGVLDGIHSFNLRLDEPANPNGAKVTIDGNPLTPSGMDFLLSGRQVIHKKLEVRQGAVALDYDSLELVLMSSCDPLNKCHQYISVHFLPASTPVRIATPDDKWVMNTNSPYDKQGYYLPVVIDGFDPDYANFDHIELQYKLSTQSENNWVTLCSYYVDSVYYKKASGNKQMFNKEAGRIDNIHFYGERDPMEQRYDLRAVSYCRYGTGYVTKASEPVSGIKDTRRPRLFGNIAPANGVLTKQDYIYVPFSEPIAYNYLDEDNNFQVVGFKNKADYFSMPTLTFSGNSDSYARTQTKRNLTGDFSIDLRVYQENTNGKVTYFSFGDGNGNGIEFGRKDSLLYARIADIDVLASKGGIPTGGFARVVMTYNAATDSIRFYVGTQPVGGGAAHSATATTFTIIEAAPFTFGVGMNNLHPFTGRMAEARIWSKTLTFGEVFSTENTCLTGYENGLLAYYPMTEGSGNIAYDKAHGADAIINNPTWTMPEGRALKVNDAKGVQLDAQWFNNSADADYTLLFSFKSDPAEPFSSDEDVLLFGDINAKMDKTNKQVGIFMTQSGQIVLASDSVNRLVAEGNYKDGAWHTLGLVVGRSFNYTHLYIDGQLKAQANGQFFGAWAMSQTILGRNFSSGCFDELSMWEFAMPQDYLSEFDTYAPNGQEMGLRCYLPFDQRILNDNSVYETHYSPYNARLYYNSDKQEWYAKQDTVIRARLDDKSTTTDVCPLIRNSEYEKIRFDWVGNNNELIINLNVPDMEINHKNVFFSLRDVEDLQGNRLLNPIAWSVYVDRNVIRWDEQNLWIIKSAGMMDTVVYTTVTNHSGKDKPFVISGLPDWLTVDETVGTLKPQEQRVLVFTVSGDLNAGDYVAPVSLTDETGMSDQMLVNVRVEAVFPNWSVPNDFNQNMNLIGTVHLQNEARGAYVDTDTRDIVGAFYGNTCVGMQSITSKVGSNANLYLKVYGKADMNKKDISLRLWQASTGKTFVLKPEKEVIRFVADTIYGSVQKPVQLRVADLRVQNIPVYTGWNWISFYVQPDSLKSSFITTGGFETNDEIKAYSAQDNVSNYMESGWSKNIKLNYRNIYMLKVKNNMVLEVRGTAADQVPELKFSHGWNNLPCLFEANTPIDAAMADYFNAAKDGDIITGYYQFAVFDNKQWVGSLETLIPGEGYMLYRQAKDDVTVHFYPSVPATAPRKGAIVESDAMQDNNRDYSTVMPIVATLESNEVAIHAGNAVLRAYAHNELVGEAKAVDGMWFLLVHAADGSELTFTVTDDKGEEYSASNVLNYGAFAPTGTVHNPYLIRFGESDLRKVMENGILYIHRNGNTYNAQGGKL